MDSHISTGRFERMWINQPSNLQQYHNMHGTNVLSSRPDEDGISRVYFLSGSVISQNIHYTALSHGWI